MFGRVFYYFLNMSITASVMTALLLIIRAVFGRFFSKTSIYYLWIIVLIRLLIPISFSSRFSILNLLGSRFIKRVEVPKISLDVPNVSIVNSLQKAKDYFPLNYKTSQWENVFSISGEVWIWGALLCLAVYLAAYFLILREIKKASPVKDEKVLKVFNENYPKEMSLRLYQTAITSSPIVAGIMKPKIMIPEGTSCEVLNFALKHELVHIKRKDNLWKAAALLAACLHWFNPVVWIFVYTVFHDMELSCDEIVIRNMEERDKRMYASSLISLAADHQALFTGFGSGSVKQRVMNIITFKPVTLAMAIITGAACIALLVIMLTNPTM